MKIRTGIGTASSRIAALFAVALVLAISLISPNSNSYANPPDEVEEFSTMERDGTFHPAPGYQPAVVEPKYRSNPPTYGHNDPYSRDEIIIRFKPEVGQAQQHALMGAHNMRFGRAIYGERAFVAKVPEGAALALSNALRHNPLLEVASVNPVFEFQYDPDDPWAREQFHLDEYHINAREGWDYGHGLGAISLIAILDSGIDAGGSDGIIHPDFIDKFRAENWQNFASCPDYDYDECRFNDLDGHGTSVAGLAAGATDNAEGIAGVGFSAWPMSLKVNMGSKDLTLDSATSAVNWAADHGASVINMSFICRGGYPGCILGETDELNLLYYAVERAYLRGITVVASAGNEGTTNPNYPAAFGQIEGVPWPPYNERLVISVSGTRGDERDPGSSYGPSIDVAAVMSEDDGRGPMSTFPTENRLGSYHRLSGGTSQAAPQVAGLASLLTTLGYTNNEVYDFIMSEATDLYCDSFWCEGYMISTQDGVE